MLIYKLLTLSWCWIKDSSYPCSRIREKEKMLDKKAKQKIINKYKIHANDTGSTQVQVAILSEEIKELTDHLKMHKHDHSSRRGLLKKVGERRRLLKYLQKEDEVAFFELAKKLKLKIAKKMIEDEDEKKRSEEIIMAKEAEKQEFKDALEEEREAAAPEKKAAA